MSIELVMPSNHLILCHPLLLLPSIFLSIRVFSTKSVLPIRWPKYWSFSFNISSSNEYSGLISFRMVWLDLLAVQGTFKSLLQHLSLKSSILRHSAFFIVQLSHPYLTTGKTIALTTWRFFGRVMSLLFNMLCFLGLEWFLSPNTIFSDLFSTDSNYLKLASLLFMRAPCHAFPLIFLFSTICRHFNMTRFYSCSSYLHCLLGRREKTKIVNPILQCRRLESDPWVGNIPWRREWLLNPLFWPGEFQGLGSQRVGHNWPTFTFWSLMKDETRIVCVF